MTKPNTFHVDEAESFAPIAQQGWRILAAWIDDSGRPSFDSYAVCGWVTSVRRTYDADSWSNEPLFQDDERQIQPAFWDAGDGLTTLAELESTSNLAAALAAPDDDDVAINTRLERRARARYARNAS